jgi:purine-binding chemotaxis protein CheW
MISAPSARNRRMGNAGAPDGSRKLVVFTVGANSFAIDGAAIAEVLPAGGIVPVRGAPGGILGFVSVRGRSIPVFDLHWKLGLPQPIDWESQRLLLLERHDGAIAAMVDSVSEVATVSSPALLSLESPGVVRHLGYIQGVLRIRERIVLWVDPALLIPAGIGEAALRAA